MPGSVPGRVAKASTGSLVQLARRARAQLATASAALIRSVSRSDNPSSGVTDPNYNCFCFSADPLPETVRQYLAATAQRELDALRAELDVRLSALEAALTSPDPHASLENLVLNLARVVAAEAESATARASLQAQLHAQDRAAAATAQVQRQLDAERAITQAVRLELEQSRTAF